MAKKKRKKPEAAAAENASPAKPIKTKRDLAVTITFLSVMVLFFASGFSSLIYQVLWTRMLVLVFGATTFATSTVLAIFMGGLALGSFLAGRVADKLKRPLLWYGVLEAVIGVWALLTPMMFGAATPLYKAVWQATHASLVQLSLLRFVCTAFILIIPTTCMGATLPLLARFVTSSLESVGSRVGALYSVNTFGAVAGAVLTGFCIMPNVGLTATLWIGAGINAFLLAGVLALVRVFPKATTTEPVIANESEAAPDAAEGKKLSRTVKLVAFVFACSGAIAMVYEVCWTRTLLMVIGSSTYAFTVMLSAFLIGIFLGSFLCSRFIDRSKQPLLWFAAFQILIGLATLDSMRNFNQIPYLNLELSKQVGKDIDLAMWLRFMLAGSVLAPITLFLGAIFPTVVKACTKDLASVGKSVGFLYSANTLGAIIGAFLAGFVCLPIFGAEKTLIYGAIINGALGLLLLWSSSKFNFKIQIAATVCSVAAMTLMLRNASVWDHNVLLNAQSAKRYMAFVDFKYKSFDDWKSVLYKNAEVKFWEDGTCSNVGIVYHPRTKVTSLVTNGHVDASDNKDMPVQALVSGFPLLLKPDAKDMAVVGWGCGQTVGICTLFPVKSIDAIELEPAVITASKFFHHLNLKPEEDPRVHIHFNDGRNFLLATDKKYDLIVSEPSNPWQAGVCNLFTKEYFHICRERLKDDGMLAAWVQCAEVPPSNLCNIFAAINSEFKYSSAFSPRPGNLVVIASQKPITLDFPKIEKALIENPKRREELGRVGIASAMDMFAHMMISSDGMKSLVANAMNTDDRNRLEFEVGRSYEDRQYAKENNKLIQSLMGDLFAQCTFTGMSKKDRALAEAGIAEAALANTDYDLAMVWAVESAKSDPNPVAFRIMGGVASEVQRWKEAETYFGRALALKPKDPYLLFLHGSSLLALNEKEKGRHELEESLALDSKADPARYSLAASYSGDLLGFPVTDKPEDAQARANAKKVLELIGKLADTEKFCRTKPMVCMVAAQAYFKLGNIDKAEFYLRRFKEYAPPNEHKVAASVLKMIDSYRASTATKTKT